MLWYTCIYLCVLFDEVAIHKQLQWVDGKMIGYEYLPGMDKKQARIASQSLVFMFCAQNDSLKIPVAYYFTNSLQATSKYSLMHDMLEDVIKTGAISTNLTFDGHGTNPAACSFFGADLNLFSSSFSTSFEFEFEHSMF